MYTIYKILAEINSGLLHKLLCNMPITYSFRILPNLLLIFLEESYVSFANLKIEMPNKCVNKDIFNLPNLNI